MADQRYHETVIIGAGPAGLQLAYFLHKAGRDYVVLEANQVAGSFFERYPRHGKLLSINKQYTGRDDLEFNLRHDWNCLLTHPGDEMPFKDFSQEYFPNHGALVTYLEAFRKRFELEVELSFRVAKVARVDDGPGRFEITRDDGERIHARRVVIATGIGKTHVPDIVGIEHAVSYAEMSLEPRDFAGKTVLILGKGNSALETAAHLMPYASFIHLSSPHPVKFAWDTHFVGYARSVNAVFFDSYLLKSQNAVLDGRTLEIERLESGKLRVRWSAIHQDVDQEIEQIDYDHVIHCCGFQMDAGFFDESCRPEMVIEGRFPAMTGSWESVNVKGLYFAGTLMQGIDYKRSQSSFIHGFRYNVRTLFHLLEHEAEGAQLPSDVVEVSASAIADKAIARANGCSALWQQVGFLCDAFVLPRDGNGPGRWYYDLNRQYVGETLGSDPEQEYYVSMLTYGPGVGSEGFEGTAFNHPHVHPNRHEREYGDLTTEIHPVLRHFRGAELVREYHVKTDVLTDWSSDFYRAPLVAFLEWDLGGGPQPQRAKERRREHIRDGRMRLVESRTDMKRDEILAEGDGEAVVGGAASGSSTPARDRPGSARRSAEG